MEYPVAPGSLRLDVGRSDHLAPPFGFISDKIAELGRRCRAWKATEVRESLLGLWIGKSGIDLAISTSSVGVFFGAPMPNHTVAS